MSDLARTNEHEQMIRSQSAKKMTDKALVSRVKRGFQKIKAELPYILELRERFAAMPRGRANIDGCKTWTEFCEKRLHRTYRQICKVLAENNDTNPTIEVTPTEPEPAPREATKPTPEETTETEQPEPAEEAEQPEPARFFPSESGDIPIVLSATKPAINPANRAASRWLAMLLLGFEAENIAKADLEEVTLADSDLAILGTVFDWLEKLIRHYATTHK